MSKKMVTPPKALRKRVKQAFTRPKAWREWKPGVQKGLGLGKFVTGLLQSITNVDDPMYDKLNYMGKGDSLRDAATRFATDDYKPLDEWEDWLSGYTGKTKMSQFSNKEIARILSTGNKNEIRGLLYAKGIKDYNWELTNIVKDTFPDLLKKHAGDVEEQTAGVGQAWERYAKSKNRNRYGTRFGVGEDKTVLDIYTGLEDKYGNIHSEILDQIVQDALGQIGQ